MFHGADNGLFTKRAVVGQLIQRRRRRQIHRQALKQQGAGVMWRLRRGGAQRQRVQELRQPGGQLFKAPAAHQGDNLLETGKERAVAQQRLRRGDTGARGNIRALRVAPCRVQVKHVIAARPAMQRITAMRRVRRDHDQIPGLQEIFLSIAQAARFTVDNRPHRELRVAVALIGLTAAPGAAQLQPRQAIVSPEGLGNISGMVHRIDLC